MINIKNFRIISVTCDVTMKETLWVVKGQWILENGRFFDEFMFSTSAQMEYVGSHIFVPTENIKRFSDMLLEETHKVIENRIKHDFEVKRETKKD